MYFSRFKEAGKSKNFFSCYFSFLQKREVGFNLFYMPGKMEKIKKASYQFIVMMGVVSLFGDMTYEGARSITGPFLAVLGASAGVVGFVTGVGEFIGYGLRLVSGYFADKTKAYWPLTFAGYALILTIPALAFTGNWKIAALLIVLERAGKAIRTPSRDAILSHAASNVGRGWGFGLHEFFDQIGAVGGPLIFTFVFLAGSNYKRGFEILWIPALLCIFFLTRARTAIPHPEKLEHGAAPEGKVEGLSRFFWAYSVFTFFSVAGAVHFQLISFHIKVKHLGPDVEIPLLYVLAMAVDGAVALAAGKLYDRTGFKGLLLAPLLCIPIPFLAFGANFWQAAGGVVLFGAIVGIHETIMRAAIGDLTGARKRGIAYGIFNSIYGLGVFAGSTIMGMLYEVSINYIHIFVIVMEAISVVIFFRFGFFGKKVRRS